MKLFIGYSQCRIIIMRLIISHNMLIEILDLTFPQGIYIQVLYQKYILQSYNHLLILQTTVDDIFYPVRTGIDVYQSSEILRRIDQSIPIPVFHLFITIQNLCRLVLILLGLRVIVFP